MGQFMGTGEYNDNLSVDNVITADIDLNTDQRAKRHSDFLECLNTLQRVFSVELVINYDVWLIAISDSECEGKQTIAEIDRETCMTHIQMSYL